MPHASRAALILELLNLLHTPLHGLFIGAEHDAHTCTLCLAFPKVERGLLSTVAVMPDPIRHSA
jgi:hypothetical protein